MRRTGLRICLRWTGRMRRFRCICGADHAAGLSGQEGLLGSEAFRLIRLVAAVVFSNTRSDTVLIRRVSVGMVNLGWQRTVRRLSNPPAAPPAKIDCHGDGDCFCDMSTLLFARHRQPTPPITLYSSGRLRPGPVRATPHSGVSPSQDHSVPHGEHIADADRVGLGSRIT
jgi:hypothetical protein